MQMQRNACTESVSDSHHGLDSQVVVGVEHTGYVAPVRAQLRRQLSTLEASRLQQSSQFIGERQFQLLGKESRVVLDMPRPFLVTLDTTDTHALSSVYLFLNASTLAM
jgi:hypothetical protein